MAEATTCQVMNSVDKKLMTVSTKWSNDNLRILILREEMEPLKAEVEIAQLTEPAKNFHRTPEEYLLELKRELSGATSGIDFSLRNRTFQWKQKAWKRGSINCETITEVIDLSNSFLTILTESSNLERSATDLKAENDVLRAKSEKLESILNGLIDSKNQMEDELYKKFLVLLNSKKRKNRQLKEKLESREIIYDRSTDVSEDEEAKMKIENDISGNVHGDNDAMKSEGLNGSNNDSDESFVLRFSQSSPTENSQKKRRKLSSSQEESQDLFSD